MSCSRTPKPPSPDSFRRALGNKEKSFSKIYRKSVTGLSSGVTMIDHPSAALGRSALRFKLQFADESR